MKKGKLIPRAYFAVDNFHTLSKRQQQALINFLNNQIAALKGGDVTAIYRSSFRVRV